MVARIGGDEFAILLYDCESPEYANHIADKILMALKDPIRICEQQPCIISVSIGISLFPQHGSTPDDLLREADEAMYSIKKQGKGDKLLSHA